MRVLTVNTGSSSVKLRVLDSEDRVVTSRDSTPDDLADDVGDLVRDVDAVGHRIVHGGPDHARPASPGPRSRVPGPDPGPPTWT